MTILVWLEKQKEFVEETSVILDKLLNWQLKRIAMHQNPPREMIEKELLKFFDLVNKGVEDGIADGIFFYERGRTLIEAFKFFEDVVPELKTLK